VLIGGTGTDKSHLAIAIARALIRSGACGRFFNVVDLVNRLETEHRPGKQGRIADYLARLDFVVLDELGYLPFPSPSPADNSSSTLSAGSSSGPRSRLHQPRLRRMARRLRRCQDDDGAARSAHPTLRDYRDRKRILALQEPLSKLKPKRPINAPDRAAQPRPAPPGRAFTVAP